MISRRGSAEDSSRPAAARSAGPVPCGARAGRGPVDRRREGRALRCRAHADLHLRGEERHRPAVGRAEFADGLLRGRLRACPDAAVAHAVRRVEQDDDLAPGACRGRRARAGPERPREREGEQRERGDAQQQQRPVADGAALHRLVRDLAQEHQRRELDDAPAIALHEVHHDRDGDRREGREQRRRQERHHRTRLMRSRVAR